MNNRKDAMSAMGATMVRKLRPSKRMKKAGHDFVAILLTVVLAVWQTPAAAFATPTEADAADATLTTQEATADTAKDSESDADTPAADEKPSAEGNKPAAETPDETSQGSQGDTGSQDTPAPAEQDSNAGQETAPVTSGEGAGSGDSGNTGNTGNAGDSDGADTSNNTPGASEGENASNAEGATQQDAAKGENKNAEEETVEPQKWTIAFDANGGTVRAGADASPLKNIVEDKDTVKLPKKLFEREDYSFVGWNTVPDPKAEGVSAKDAKFVPEGVELFNLSYHYVVLTKGNASADELKAAVKTTAGKKIQVVGDDAAAKGYDSKGRTVHTCDLSKLAKGGKLVLYAQWKENPKEADADKATDGEEAAEDADASDDADEEDADDGEDDADDADAQPVVDTPVQNPVDPVEEQGVFDTQNPGFNTVNSDGTVTDADGYDWYIAPDDELDEETADSDESDEGADGDADADNSGDADGDVTDAEAADGQNPGEVADSGEGDAEATAALDKAQAQLNALENGTGINLFGLRLMGEDPVALDELPVEGDGSKIEAIRVKWLTPDTDGTAYTGDDSRLSLKPGNDSPLAMKYQVEFSLSGQYDYEAGDVEFTIPATIWKDRDGKSVGYLTLSVPEDPEKGADFAYRLVGDKYIITNTHRLSAASKAAFQFTVRGITPHTVVDSVIPVENYPGGAAQAEADGKTVIDGNVVDNNVSALIQPTITVRTHEGNTLSLTANAIDATIDTAEVITSASKSGELFETAPSNLPEALLANLPEGATADDYIYVRWQTYSYHKGNQFFTINTQDQLQDDYQGIILGGVNTSGQAVGEVSDDARSIDLGRVYGPGYHADTTYLYDHLQYVWSAYPKYVEDEATGQMKEQFEPGGVYEFPNQADWSLTGADDGIVTDKHPQAKVVYAPQKFHVDPGDFALYKYTENVYKDYTYGYYLDQLRAGKSVNMNFRVGSVGYPYYWTRDAKLPKPSDDVADSPDNYGKRDVKFTTYDDATFFNYDWETPITHEDFEFASIRFATPTMYNYVKRANGTWGYQASSDATLKPEIEVYGQIAESGEWKYFATVSWNGNSRAENGATISGTTVTFPENVSDVKHEFVTKAAEVRVDAYPVIRLKASDAVVAAVEKLYQESETPVTKFQNNAHMDVSWPDTQENIYSGADQSRATLTGTTLAISSDKSVSFNAAVDNDAVRQRVTLHYTARVYEQTNIENREQYDAAVEAGILPRETGGTFYDLLPKGVTPVTSSIKLRSGDAVKDVYTVENYKDSGRTLLVVKADLTPAPTTISRKYADIPQLSFDAWYPWDKARDLGLTLVNRIAFESGSEGTYGSTVIDGQFGNVRDHMGEKDDPTGANGYLNNQTKAAVGEDAELLRDLDPDTDKGGFVYAKCQYTIDADVSAFTSANKYVMDDSKGYWTHGLKNDREQVTVYPGHPYTYRLFAEAGTSASKGIILYDTLENYIPTEDKGKDGDYGHPQWRGIFRSVDVSQLERLDIAPVVYYATIDHLPFEDSEDDAGRDRLSMKQLVGNYDIHNKAIWSTTPPADLSQVTAIAIDASKKTDGSDFILGTYLDDDGNAVTEAESIAVLIHMVAPVDNDILYGDETGIGSETWASGGENAIFAAGDDKYDAANNRYAYNNMRLVCYEALGEVFNETTDSTRQMIRYDYTRVGILPYELTIKKLWNDADDNDGKRPESVAVNLQASTYDSNGRVTTTEAEYTDPTAGPNGDGKVGSVELSAENGWTATIQGVKYVNDEVNYTPLHYSLTEDEVAGYRFSAQQGNRSVNGALIDDADNYFTVINTHPLDKVKLSGKKTWNDDDDAAGMRPASINVKLYADGKLVQMKKVTAGDAGDWSYSFGELNKYKRVNGTTSEIEYTVEEDYVPKYVQNQEASEGLNLANDYHPYGDLSVQKNLVDATDVAADTDFEFTVLLTREKANADDAPMPVDGSFAYTVVDAKTGEAVKDAQGEQLGGTVSSGGSIVLKGGQRAIIHDLPSECTYEVVEEQRDGFTQTAASGTTGTVHAGQEVAAEFTNTYAANGSVQLGATKELAGHTLARYQFRFRLATTYEDAKNATDTYLRSGSNAEPGEDGTGEVTFGAIRYTQADAGQTYSYYLYEVDTAKAGYAYDDSIYKVDVAVTDNGDGTLSCVPTYYRQARDEAGAVVEGKWEPLAAADAEGADESGEAGSAGEASGEAGGSATGEAETGDDAVVQPVFHNEYHATGKLALKAWKVLEGRSLKDGEFSFQLRDGETGQVLWLDTAKGEEGTFNIVDAQAAEAADEGEGEPAEGEAAQSAPVEQVKTNAADGTISFDDIVWDESVLQEVNEETGEVTYLDKKVYLFTVNEVPGADPTVVYDPSFKGYEVTVFDNGDGTLSIAQGNVDVSGRYTKCETCDNKGWSYCSECLGTGFTFARTGTYSRYNGGTSGVVSIKKFPGFCSTCLSTGFVVNEESGERKFCPDCGGTGSTEYKARADAQPETYELTQFNTWAHRWKGKNALHNLSTDRFSTVELETVCNHLHDYASVDNAVICATCDGAGYLLNPDWTLEDADEAGTPIFTNTLNPGNLAITKLTDGTGDASQPFTFRVELAGEGFDESGYSYELTRTDAAPAAATAPEAAKEEDANGDGANALAGALAFANPLAFLFAPQKAYADETATGGVFHATEDMLEGKAYAVLDSAGTLTFFRSNNTYTNKSTYSNIVDIKGNMYSGKVFAGFEAVVDEYKNNGATSGSTLSSKYGWNSDMGKIKKVTIAEGQAIKPEHTLSSWFYKATNLTSVDLSRLDTSLVESMRSTFYSCPVTELDLSMLDTSNVVDFGWFFADAVNLKRVDLSNFDTSKVWRFYSMFFKCNSLEEVDVSSFDTSSGTDFKHMFRECNSLTNLDLSGFDTSKADEMAMMFHNCTSLESLDISSFDTSTVNKHATPDWNKVTGLDQIFDGCTSLKEVRLGSNFSFVGDGSTSCELPASPESPHGGKWMLDETGADSYSPAELASNYNSSIAGKWVWAYDTSHYGIAYNANGGSGSMALTTAEVGSSVKLAESKFYTYEQHMTGWNTEPDGSGTSYGLEQEVTDIAPAGSIITLYAQWERDQHPVDIGEGSFEITLYAGETATIANLPAGTAYRVYEETPQGWVLVSQQNTAGTIPSLDTAHAVFTNSYVPGETQAQVYAIKTLDGNPAPDGKFSFQLKQGDTVLQTAANTSGGFVQFDPLSYDESIFGDDETEKTFTYSIVEVIGDDSAIAYDEHAEDVTVTVKKQQDGTISVLSAQVSYDEDGAVFANTTKPGELALTKSVEDVSGDMAEGGEGPDFEFTVRFHNEYGQPVDASSVQYYKTSAADAAGEAEPADEAGDESGTASEDEQPTSSEPAENGENTSGLSAKAATINPLASAAGTLLSLLPTQKAYGAEVNTSRQFHVADLFDGDTAKAEAYLSQNAAYAVLTNENDERGAGTLVFFRSAQKYTNKTVGGPFYDSNGNEYYGRIFAGFENRNSSYNPSTDVFWYPFRDGIKKVIVAEGQAIRPVYTARWFEYASNITEMDLSRIDTSKTISMLYMFDGCNGLKELDLSTFDTSNVTNMKGMLYSCQGLVKVDVSSFDTSKVATMAWMFRDTNKLTSLDISNFDTSNVTDMSYMFYNCLRRLSDVDFSRLNTSKVTTMEGMFKDCVALESLNLSTFDTSNVTTMSQMFSGCTNLKSVDVSSFKTDKVTNMSNMFYNCSSLTNLDMSNFDTSNVTTMKYMLAYCKAIKVFDLSNFNTAKVADMSCMFYGDTALKEFKEQFNTPSLTTMECMFDECSNLTDVDLSSFNTSKVTRMPHMFDKCKSLKTLDISSFDTSKVTSMYKMFSDVKDLESVKLGPGFSFKGGGISKTSDWALLPSASSSGAYSGKWTLKEDRSLEMTSQELQKEYGDNADAWKGTWVWALRDTAYTVLLEPGAGSVANQRVYGLVNSGVTLPTPTRPGYKFDGWNTAADGSGKTFAAKAGQKVSNEAGSTTTLYAQYSLDPKLSYTVTHNQETVAGGEYVLAEKLSGAEVSNAASLDAKEYPGFVLNAGKSASGLSDDGTSYAADYYYDRVRYTVAFDANGGQGSMDSINLVGGVSRTLPGNTFTNGSSAFVGWNTAANGSGTQYVDTAKVLNLAKTQGDTITLYAQWATLETPEGDPTNGEFTITLKAGETAHFVNLPAGTTYQIVEGKTEGEGADAQFVEGSMPDGWSLVSTEGDTGVIAAAEISDADFTNIYQATGFASLEARKLLRGDTPQSGQFAFQLHKDGPDGEVLQTVSNGSVDDNATVADAEGGEEADNPHYGTAPVRFDDIEFDKAGTYTFAITEVAGDDPAITYDGRDITATVVMTDDNAGHLTPAVTYEGGDGDAANTLVNTVNPGSLSLVKHVVNETDANADATFTFKLALFDANGNPLANQAYKAVGDVMLPVVTNAEGVATVQLKGGQALAINDLPHGATYTLVEDDESMPEGFTGTNVTGGQGTIVATETAVASFENTYEATGSIRLAALKNLTGRDLKAGEFTFELRNANGDVLQSQANDAEGKVSFDSIGYTLSQVLRDAETGAATAVYDDEGVVSAWTYAYSIDEYLPSGADTVRIDGVLYDAHVEDVLVTVTDNGDGTLATSVDYSYVSGVDEEGNTVSTHRGADGEEAVPMFANDYSETALVAKLEFVKHYNEGDATFAFELAPVKVDADGKPVAGGEEKAFATEGELMTANNGDFKDGAATVEFNVGPYSKDGDYYYLARETTNATDELTVDDVQYLVHVQVKQDVVQDPVYTMYYPDADGGWEDLGTVSTPDFYNNDTQGAVALDFSSMSYAVTTDDAAVTSVFPTVKKYLNGSTDQLVGGDYTFELADSEGNLVAAASNDANGDVAFFDADSLGLVYDAPGTYTYAITERVPEGAKQGADGNWELSGAIYDGTTITLTVEVVQDADGALSASASYSGYDGDEPAFYNSVEGIDLEVYKVSRSGGEGLEDCTYALWMVGPAGDVMLQEATSDAKGRILFTNVALRQGQLYYFKEVEAPSGHTVDPYRTAYFTLNETGDGTVLAEEVASDGWHSKYDK